MKTIQFHGHKNIIAQRLLQAREASGLSQQELAEKLQIMGASIDQQGISKIELDNRLVTDYELVCFCRVLSVELDWLVKDFDSATMD